MLPPSARASPTSLSPQNTSSERRFANRQRPRCNRKRPGCAVLQCSPLAPHARATCVARARAARPRMRIARRRRALRLSAPRARAPPVLERRLRARSSQDAHPRRLRRARQQPYMKSERPLVTNQSPIFRKTATGRGQPKTPSRRHGPRPHRPPASSSGRAKRCICRAGRSGRRRRRWRTTRTRCSGSPTRSRR